MDRQVLVLLAVHVVNEHPDLPRWNGEPFRALDRPFGILRGPARGHRHHGLQAREHGGKWRAHHCDAGQDVSESEAHSGVDGCPAIGQLVAYNFAEIVIKGS
jgi:hypothetical protein